MVCGCLRLFAVVEEPEGWPQRDAKKTQKEEEMSGRGRWTLDAGRWTLDAGRWRFVFAAGGQRGRGGGD